MPHYRLELYAHCAFRRMGQAGAGRHTPALRAARRAMMCKWTNPMMKQQTQIRITRFALITLAIVCAQWFASAACATPNGRERLLMDSGWRFHLGDMNQDKNARAAIAEWRWKNVDRRQGTGSVLCQQSRLHRNDLWKKAAVGEDTFHGRSGFAWYRTLLPDLPGPHRVLHFDSVDDNATVFVNGKRLLHHEDGTKHSMCRSTRVWKESGPNVVAVLVENTAGAGGIGVAAVTKGEAQVDNGPAAPDFNDGDWRAVHLPHDFVVEGTFTPKADARTAHCRPMSAGIARRSRSQRRTKDVGSGWTSMACTATAMCG